MIELIVVIAILSVMGAVLVPTFLSYVENSRAQKDASATGELVQAINIALADNDKESGYKKYKVISEIQKI